ncbi:hypothetical protein KGQ25_02910 [Patescibacteria group bacterium]|nr:hypothetical protein [Patescibacteria group bacterium]MDE2173602.1 hypothetical protein [Patescibacteria group bacterium]
MPSRRNSNDSQPPQAMTWAKALPILVIAGIFDALRFMFEQFWFFGPALAGVGVAVATSGWVGSWVGGALGAATGAVLGFFGGAALEIFGIVMAMAVGLLGWLTIGLLLMITNGRLFKEQAGNTIWFMFGLFISEIPIIGSLPGLTGVTFKMYHAQIREEKKALARYEKERVGMLQQEREARARQIMQVRAVQLAQAEQQEAMNEESYDDEEIPDEVREAA